MTNHQALPNKSITVSLRRDGKYTAQYHFPVSGARITKILTPAQLETETTKGYDIYGLR